MILNYLKTTWRNLVRNKVFSFINVLGLSVGLACCLLIFLYAKDEISYDRFHRGVENIYRITATMTSPEGNVMKTGNTGMMPGPSFKRELPQIEDFVRVQSDGYTVRLGTQVFDQPALAVDENFFSIFSFPLLQGDPKTVLKDPRSVVLSEEEAQKYFGKQNALGQVLELKTRNGFIPFRVAGVVKRSPQNSSIKISMLVPMKFVESMMGDNQWVNFFLHTFVVLRPGTDTKALEARFAQIFQKEAVVQLKEMREKYGYKDKLQFGLQPMLQMHLSKDFRSDNGLSDASNTRYSLILSGLALFIFVIACINFINLTLARSLKRAREIGVRKVMGGQRRQLVFQFLGESFFISFIAFVLAIGLVQLVLPLFNHLANKALAFSYLLDAGLVAGYIAMYLLTGLLAGFYPALVLSRFHPVDTLYGRQRFGGRNLLSKSLVVLQFTLSAFLVVATIVIYAQFRYLIQFDLGYNDENVAVVRAGRINRQDVSLLKNELLKNPAVLMVSADQGGRWGTNARVNGGTDIAFDLRIVDEHYFPLLQVPFAAGRNFSLAHATDTAEAAVVNETFVRQAGWKMPLGQAVDFFFQNKKYHVIGVVRDYHYAALNEPVGPQLFLANPEYQYGDVYIKLRAGSSAQALPYVQQTFRRLFPFQPYEYGFKAEQNALQYESEAKWKQIITFGALLTLFISGIGLFGLAMLSAEKRTKEIGIRKVLGASVPAIVKKLSADFLKLVVLAAALAAPAAWWAMSRWLEDYPYRIAISWWMFALAMLLVFFIALFTIGFHALKTAMANPVKSLRTE